MALSPSLSDIEPLGVQAIDGLFSEDEIGALIQTVQAIPLYFINHAAPEQAHHLYTHWAYPIVSVERNAPRDISAELEALDETLDPIRNAWYRVRRLLASTATTVNCYVNGYTYGTDGYPHYEVASPRAAEQRTILIYCCPSWEPGWGGETVFFDRDGDVSAAVLPKPGRVVVLRGDVLHVARAPSRFCPIDRRVLVFKAWTHGLPIVNKAAPLEKRT